MSYLFPFIKFLNSVLDIYAFLLVVWVVLHLLDHFNIINSRHVFVMKITHFLNALFSYPLGLIKRFVPIIGGVDISPIILYLLISLIQITLFTFVY